MKRQISVQLILMNVETIHVILKLIVETQKEALNVSVEEDILVMVSGVKKPCCNLTSEMEIWCSCTDQ